MNQNNQVPIFPMIQLPMMGPQQNQMPAEEEPARVRVAMEVLAQLSFKTMARAAVNDIAIEQIEGQKLTTSEANLQSTACNFLNDYLLGKMKLDRNEREIREVRLYGSESPVPGEMGMLIRCFNCAPSPPNPSCPFCKGLGGVLVYPNQGGAS